MQYNFYSHILMSKTTLLAGDKSQSRQVQVLCKVPQVLFCQYIQNLTYQIMGELSKKIHCNIPEVLFCHFMQNRIKQVTGEM